MKQIFILACLSVFTISMHAQSPDTIKVALQQEEDSIFTKTEVYAEFPGGDKAWSDYLLSTLDAVIPVMNGAKKGKYLVVIKFVINKDGSIENAMAETKFGFGMEAEALRVITDGPTWLPARHKGKNVRSYRRQPITFFVD